MEPGELHEAMGQAHSSGQKENNSQASKRGAEKLVEVDSPKHREPEFYFARTNPNAILCTALLSQDWLQDSKGVGVPYGGNFVCERRSTKRSILSMCAQNRIRSEENSPLREDSVVAPAAGHIGNATIWLALRFRKV